MPVQLTVPDSKPGLASFWPEQPPTAGCRSVQVGSPDWAGTLTAFQAALTVLNSVQLAGYRFLAAVSVQVRYFRYDDDEVFISIALYMIFVAFWMPEAGHVVPLQVGLVGWPLVGLVPSASR